MWQVYVIVNGQYQLISERETRELAQAAADALEAHRYFCVVVPAV